MKKLLRLITIFCFLNSATLFAQTVVPSSDQRLYTKQDIKFELLIPNARAENVQIQTANTPNGVTLKTLRKTTQYGETEGALIELWYNFDKPGNYTLPRITCLVQNRRRYFYFETVNITDNPANMMPRIVIEFDNGTVIRSDDPTPTKPVFTAEAGQQLKFKVNLQYATQLVQFNWDIPKDSIFKQTKVYDITEIKYREKKYTADLIPVADFEWTVLSKGLSPMPKIRLVATAYNGYRNELILPNFAVNFVESKNGSNNSDNSLVNDIYEDAFTSTYATEFDAKHKEISYEDCVAIAELRHGEKTNILKSHEFKMARIEKEEELDLPSEYNEFYLGFFVMSIGLFIFTVILLIIFIKRKNSILMIINSSFVICAIAISVYSYVKYNEAYGISTGSVLYSIPEEKQIATGEITPGNRVQIIEKVENWYYVEMGSISGWTNSTSILEN